MADGVGYVAVRTEMPGVTGAMVDWWFDWHPRESMRYRVWHPRAHRANSLDAPARPRARRHWGAVHHPVEDVGLGVVRARIAFISPSEMGLADDALEDANVASIVCGYVADERTRVRHTPMFHVFVRETTARRRVAQSLLARRRDPPATGRSASPGELLLNNRLARRRGAPRRAPARAGAALRRGVREPGDVAAGAVCAILRRPHLESPEAPSDGEPVLASGPAVGGILA